MLAFPGRTDRILHTTLAAVTRALQALLRVPGARAVLAACVRAASGVASLARRVAALDPGLAERTGIEAQGAARSSVPFAIDPPAPEPAADLDAIPSETTPSERRFLYSFFAHVWHGGANVVEVGPFLGGTTRAVALGMLANPRRDPAARLYTYDRFDGYWAPDDLEGLLEPLFASGVLGAAERDAVLASGSFGEVFDRVHGGTPYGDLIERSSRALPDTPDEGKWDLEPGVEVDAVFVDGCKSWYGTKQFMRASLAAAKPGTHVLFQDYGWYTCFWLPAFVHAMGGSFAPFAATDTTYAFHLAQPVAVGAVGERFPDDPADLGAAWFATAFDALRADATARGDDYAHTVLGLQHGAALAYLGDAEAARARIEQVRREAGRANELRALIAAAAASPTYRPGGEPIRL